MAVASLKKGEWFIGGQFNGGRMILLQRRLV